MRPPRFHAHLQGGPSLWLEGSQAAHALRVLRLSAGDEVVLFDGLGREADGRIKSHGGSKLEIEIGPIRVCQRPLPRLSLAVALPKGPRQDTLIEKCAELGLDALIPLTTERSVSSASHHKLERWQRMAVEAAKQSRQPWLTEFLPPHSLAEAIDRARGYDQRLAAHPGPDAAGPPPLRFRGRVLAFVGPEGGFTDEEIDLLAAAGIERLALGPNILRIETAAIALAVMVHLVQRPCEPQQAAGAAPPGEST